MIPEQISYFVLMGDSLSDRSSLFKRNIFGCIPMKWITGLEKKSPAGRFTNGLVWSDHISATVAEHFIINEIAYETGMDSTDISDAVIAHDRKVDQLVHSSYSLNDDMYVRYKGVDFVRSYCEGGLSSHDYSWVPSSSLNRFFQRMVVATLDEMRKKLLDYDKAYAVSDQHREQTLIVEWSGANDFITVNARPSIKEADQALEARIENVQQLINKGYRHFVLFNLPDLSLTPRFQRKTDYERDNAKACSLYFNEQLRKGCNELKVMNPHCSIEYYDINEIFTDIIHNPKQYGFEADKVSSPFTESPDFEIEDDGTSPATGYIFWDDIHPSADMHALLSAKFYAKYKFKYNFTAPDFLSESTHQDKIPEISELRRQFIAEYETRLAKDRMSFFGCLKASNIDYRNAGLDEIFRHALHEKGFRTRDTLVYLEWIDKKGKLKLKIPPLETALMVAEAKAEISLAKFSM